MHRSLTGLVLTELGTVGRLGSVPLARTVVLGAAVRDLHLGWAVPTDPGGMMCCVGTAQQPEELEQGHPWA